MKLLFAPLELCATEPVWRRREEEEGSWEGEKERTGEYKAVGLRGIHWHIVPFAKWLAGSTWPNYGARRHRAIIGDTHQCMTPPIVAVAKW